MSSVVQALGAIIEQGVADGRFRRAHPLLVHAGIVAPLMMFLASAPLRARLSKLAWPTRCRSIRARSCPTCSA